MQVEPAEDGRRPAVAPARAKRAAAARFRWGTAPCASRNAWRVAAAVLLAIAAVSNPKAADVLTQHNDNGRTGANSAETLLNTTSVKPDTFGRLWTLFVDGQVVAQPLYVSQLRIDTSTNPNAPLVRGT